MRLTDKAIKSAKPSDKPYKIFDGEGLYLEVRPNGSKYWRMKCSFFRKPILLSFGVYPSVTLSEARQRREEAKETLSEGKDPRLHRRGQPNDFKTAATNWIESKSRVWSDAYRQTVQHRLESDVFPKIGHLPIQKLDSQNILGVIREIDGRGAPVKAKRVLGYIRQALSYAIITTGNIKINPAIGLSEAVSAKPVVHNPHLRESELADFLRVLDGYNGNRIVKLAALFMLLTLTRTKETRFAKSGEFDFTSKSWTPDIKNMKKRRKHIVPLSRQSEAIVKEAIAITGAKAGDYIFQSPRKRGQPISENAILYAIYEMGYKGRLTGHGFRGTASTILNERGYNPRAIDIQLSHIGKGKVEAAYNHAELLSERRKIIQDWADLIDDLRKNP